MITNMAWICTGGGFSLFCSDLFLPALIASPLLLLFLAWMIKRSSDDSATSQTGPRVNKFVRVMLIIVFVLVALFLLNILRIFI